MVCCLKESNLATTAVFTCEDPGNYCANKITCEEGYNVDTIEIVGCTFSQLPYNVFTSYKWRRNIYTVNISNIGLTSIEADYFKMRAIWELYLSNNNLTALSEGSFSGKKVEQLDLSRIRFDSIAAVGKTDLEDIRMLNLSNNRIFSPKSDDFSGLKTLSQLDLSSNKIETIPSGVFALIRNLQHLSLSSNKLSTLVKNSFPSNLISLDLSYNTIDKIETAQLQGPLERLIVTNNHIFQLNSKTFSELTQLKEIDFSFNQIYSLETGTFWKLKSLKSLTLAHNRIVDFHIWDLPISIQKINVSYNGLTTLELDGITNLQKVTAFNVGSNNISSFCGFRRRILSKLEYIDLTRNRILCSELKSALESFSGYELEIEIQPSNELVSRRSYRGVQCDGPL